MKFLAIDTSGKHLSVVAYADGKTEYTFLPECAMKHSVVLMDRIDNVLTRAHMSPADCDFFACTVGPGSFTGIRIGISTVKGLCFSVGKPAVPLTSFDCLAYAETGRELALVDAGHGNYYACGYTDGVAETPAFLTEEEVRAKCAEGYAPVSAERLAVESRIVDPCAGLMKAALKKSAATGQLTALYLRKPSAEEKR